MNYQYGEEIEYEYKLTLPEDKEKLQAFSCGNEQLDYYIHAENVVYYATKEAYEKGFIPTLYTNADYAASNKCYQKVGFEIRGSLCMVGFDKN